MEKNHSVRLISAFSAVLLLSFFSFISSPQNEANALQLATLSLGNTLQRTGIVEPMVFNNWNAFAVAMGYNGVLNAQNVEIINASNDILLANYSLASSIGGTNKYIDGISCQSTGQIYHSSTVAKGATEYCAITATGGTGSDRVFLIDVTNGFLPGNTGSGFSYTNGYMAQRCTLTGIPQLGGTVNCYNWDSGGTNSVYIDYLAINYTIVNSQPTLPQIGKPFIRTSHFNTGFTGSNANDVQITTLINANTGFATNEIGWTIAGGTSFVLFNLGSQATICQVSMGVTGYTVQFGVTNGVQSWYINTDNSMKIIQDATCTINNTLTLTTYDNLGTHIRGITIGSILNQIYITDDQQKLLAINNTTPYPLASTNNINQDCIGASGSGKRCIAVVDNPTITGAGQTDIGIASTTSNLFSILYWGTRGSVTGSTPNGSQTVCFDTSPKGGSAPQLTCLTCPGTFGTPQAVSTNPNTFCPFGYPNPTQANGLPMQFRGSMNGSQSIDALGCFIGYFSCTNTDTKSNGTGFAVLIILIIASTIAILYATYRTGHEVKEVLYPIVLVSILWCGVTWQAGLTSNLPFYVGILVLGGLFAKMIFEKVRGSGE